MSELRAKLNNIRALVHEFNVGPHRRAIARAKREEDDLFMLLVFSEMMGIPNPASYYMLELQPVVLERFHDWHTHMGMKRSPLDGIPCC